MPVSLSVCRSQFRHDLDEFWEVVCSFFLPGQLIENHVVAIRVPSPVSPLTSEAELAFAIGVITITPLDLDSDKSAPGCLDQEVRVVVDESVDAERIWLAFDDTMPPDDVVEGSRLLGNLLAALGRDHSDPTICRVHCPVKIRSRDPPHNSPHLCNNVVLSNRQS